MLPAHYPRGIPPLTPRTRMKKSIARLLFVGALAVGGFATQANATCYVNGGTCTATGNCPVNVTGSCAGNCLVNAGNCQAGGNCTVNAGTCANGGECLVNTGVCLNLPVE